MTRNHFNKPRIEKYINGPHFVNTKEYQVEVRVSNTYRKIVNGVLSIPRRLWARARKLKRH